MAADAGPSSEELSESAARETSPTALSDADQGPSGPAKQASEQEHAADALADDAADHDDEADNEEQAAPAKRPWSRVRLATVVGAAAVVVLAALVGWLGFHAYQSRQAQHQRELFVQVGRQGALNLTTIDWQHADSDVQRVLDSATGTFYDDFASRKQPFIDVVKKAQSKSVGTVHEAGLESESGDEAVVLVSVSIKTSNLGAAEQEPRAWRMRISVQRVGDDAKIANVQFVP
jgi:Mce-associated membrane protein